jgi:hypothetical protein
MESNSSAITTWPEFAMGLYDQLTKRQAEITYDFDEFAIEVPSKTGDITNNAQWRLNGSLKISTRDKVTD